MYTFFATFKQKKGIFSTAQCGKANGKYDFVRVASLEVTAHNAGQN
jgi:hypothetical protein